MTRRSFLFLALIFALILSVSSVAFADASITVDNSVGETPATVTATLTGGDTLSAQKVDSFYHTGDNALAFEIVKPMEASDWKYDSEHNVNYLEYEVFTKILDGSYWYKLNIGNWTSDFKTTRDSAGNLYGQAGDGYRIDEPNFSNGPIWREYTYTWYDNDKSTVLETTSFNVVVNYRALPYAADRDRITAAAGGSVSHGAVSYTASDTPVNTIVAVPHADVVKCSINGGEITNVENGAITLSTDANQRYEIMWYDVGENLWSAEYVDILFISPANDFTWIDWSCFAPSTVNGILGNKPVISNGTNRQGISVTYLTYNLDLSQMDLQQLLYYHGDGETLAAPYRVNLPSTAVKKYSFGTAADMRKDEVMESLGIMDYEICDGNNNGIQHLIEMGYSTADGSSVIITPQGGERAQLIKWIDADGKEYYHMIVFVFNFASDNSYRVEAINPSVERVQFNVNSHPAIKDDPRPSYVNGVVTYTAGPREDGAPESVCTAIDKPFADVTGVTVYPQWGNSYGYDFTQSDLPCIIESFVPNGSVGSEVYQLEWTRENGSSYLELITVYVISDGDTWMEQHWVPAAVGRTQPITDQSDVLEEHLSYDADTGRWLFDIDAASNPNLDDEAFGYPVFMITPPEGATHYTVALWGSPIYSDHLAETIEIQLQSDFDNNRLNPIEDDTNSLLWYDQELEKLCYTPCGKLLTRTALADTDGMSIYTVNATMPGHAQIAVFEWFKPNEEDGYDQIMFDGNKRGEFVYCEKNPYLNVKVTDIKDAITAPVTEPTAVVLESTSTSLVGLKLRCEIPLQKNAGKNYWYKYYKLDLVDENGNVVELPAGSKIKVYIPYPEGTDMNSKIQHFDVWHYHDENHGSHDSMRNDGVLKLEEYGITFETTSFSPFLLAYELDVSEEDFEAVPAEQPKKLSDYTGDSFGYKEETITALENNLKADLGDNVTVSGINELLEKTVKDSFGPDHGKVTTKVIELVLKYKTGDDEGKTITEDKLDNVPEEGVDALIKYSDIGFTDVENYSRYRFVVSHMIIAPRNGYKPGDIEAVEVTNVNEKGITIKVVNGFSPFVVAYAEKPATPGNTTSSGGSGISVTYNGGNSFSTSKSAVPTSVEIDGEPVSFTGDGRSFTVSSIPAGAKWITVRWNSTSITVSFKPDAAMVYADMAIPKTGDVSILMPVLMLLGAAAIRRRK